MGVIADAVGDGDVRRKLGIPNGYVDISSFLCYSLLTLLSSTGSVISIASSLGNSEGCRNTTPVSFFSLGTCRWELNLFILVDFSADQVAFALIPCFRPFFLKMFVHDLRYNLNFWRNN